MKKIVKILAILLIFSACSKKSEEEVLPTPPMYLEFANWTLTKISSKTNVALNNTQPLTSCSETSWIFKDNNIIISTTNKYNCSVSQSFDRNFYQVDKDKITFTSSYNEPLGEATLAYSGNTMTWSFPSGNTTYNLKYDYTLTFTEK